MKAPITLLVTVIATAACDSSRTIHAENASVAEVAKAARGAPKIDPGKWRTKVVLSSFDIPGMPPEFAETMKRRMAVEATRSLETCVTPEMAERPPGEMFGARNSCRYETFTMGDGKLEAVMVCQDESGAGEVRMTIAGEYGGGRYDLASDMKMSGPAGAGAMSMKARVTGERVGACDAPSAG